MTTIVEFRWLVRRNNVTMAQCKAHQELSQLSMMDCKRALVNEKPPVLQQWNEFACGWVDVPTEYEEHPK